MNTKEKILESAICLFNEHGLANVRLQQIADETGISVGNLAYHFKNKDLIIASVYEVAFEEYASALSVFQARPGFIGLDDQLERFYDFFFRFSFCVADQIEVSRNYPSVMLRWQSLAVKMQMQIRKRLEGFARAGLLKPEEFQGTYDLLAHTIWLNIVFWGPQQALKGQANSLDNFRTAIWNQIKPYFTPLGKQAFFEMAHIERW